MAATASSLDTCQLANELARVLSVPTSAVGMRIDSVNGGSPDGSRLHNATRCATEDEMASGQRRLSQPVKPTQRRSDHGGDRRMLLRTRSTAADGVTADIAAGRRLSEAGGAAGGVGGEGSTGDLFTIHVTVESASQADAAQVERAIEGQSTQSLGTAIGLPVLSISEVLLSGVECSSCLRPACLHPLFLLASSLLATLRNSQLLIPLA